MNRFAVGLLATLSVALFVVGGASCFSAYAQPVDPLNPTLNGVTATTIVSTGTITAPCNAGATFRFGPFGGSSYSGMGCNSGAPTFSLAGTVYAEFDAANGALKFNQGSGNNAIGLTVNGARLDFGNGSADYLYSDGTSVIAGGAITSTGSFIANANNAFGFTNVGATGHYIGFGTNLTTPNTACNTTATPSGFNSSLAYDGDGWFHIACQNGAVNRLSGVINSDTTGVGNVNTSGPDDLQTYTLPASILVHTGRCVRVTATGTTANNANAKTVRLVFGATPTALITKQLTASIAGSWQLTGTVCRTGSSTQRYYGTGENSGGTTVSTTDGTGVWRVPTVTGTATETETNTMVFKTQSTASTADNDIVSQHFLVELL